MPIYEYELLDGECLMCPGRIQALQASEEDPLRFCPSCGLGIKRVVSQVQVVKSVSIAADDAAKKGFSTYRRAEAGHWEKLAGAGPDGLVGTDADKQAVAQKPAPLLNLDK